MVCYLDPASTAWEFCSTHFTQPCNAVTECDSSKRVTFSSTIGYVRIPNMCDIPEEEKEKLWHPEPTSDKKSKNVLRLLLCGSNRPSDSDDGAGYFANDGDDDYRPYSSSTSSKRKFPIEAVLTEQDYQRYEGSNDPDLLARIYSKCSAHGASRAYMRARLLEADIRNYVLAKSREPRSGGKGSLFSRLRKR